MNFKTVKNIAYSTIVYNYIIHDMMAKLDDYYTKFKYFRPSNIMLARPINFMAHNPDYGPLHDFAIVQNHMSFIGGDIRLMDTVLKYSYCYFNDYLINVEAQNLLSTHNHDMDIDLINQVVT